MLQKLFVTQWFSSQTNMVVISGNHKNFKTVDYSIENLELVTVKRIIRL